MFGSSGRIREIISNNSGLNSVIAGYPATVRLNCVHSGTTLGTKPGWLKGNSLLLLTKDHFHSALAALELDGIARRLVLCPPDTPAEHLGYICDSAQVDAIVADTDDLPACVQGRFPVFVCGSRIEPAEHDSTEILDTEWILLTSGTTGRPKLVVHSLATLTAPIAPVPSPSGKVVWSTFYDTRRYGGLQILLRAVLTSSSLVLKGADESTSEFLKRAAALGVTHISGTPTHWRGALMEPAARMIAPRYVRLSGEIADQAILDNLCQFFPEAGISHAFATTEAGVAFEVKDGRSGFNTGTLSETPEVEMKVENGSLRIRSSRTALGYLGDHAAETPKSVAGPDGFVDTADLVELRGNRYHFTGRRDGVINVGGMKVHPEEVEQVINGHPEVAMSVVRAKASSITGSVVVAEIVLRKPDGNRSARDLQSQILQWCRHALPAHKVPVTIRVVSALTTSNTGKLMRRDA